MALALSLAVSAAEARSHRDTEIDSVRHARRITISDRGVIIERDPDPSAGDDGDRGPMRVRGTIDLSKGRIQLTGTGDGETVRVDRGSGSVRIGPHITIDDDGDGEIVRMFSDAHVRRGERVDGNVVAVFGSVLVEGEVLGDVVAVMGSVRLTPGARVTGEVVAVGGGLDQPPGAIVDGESVSLSFLPMAWGVPTLQMLLSAVVVGWLLSLFMGWLIVLLFPTRMLRVAATVSRRSGVSVLLGLASAPLLVILIVLLMITVIGIPLAFLLPLVYMMVVWVGQLGAAYVLGCRAMRRRLGEGGAMGPLFVGTLLVASFFLMAAALAGPEGAGRSIALFFTLLGGLLVVGLSVIGTGAVLLSSFGARPEDVVFGRAGQATGPAPGAPPAPALPPS